ncbi:anti-sigma factor [Burkholderia gladioli]|uniref:anti-sigma factor n=1 Tax=Burkholderia TaxID=32008 RepID=UPI00119C493D|nr:MULTISPECIES: anti-sigma factor [Burkholderia]MBJ9664304.1 anti-sigma factor [Burkholderia gladioli]MBU9171934.1 anti-sigma factor [Burkholderia gladioli]MBU9198400.1 anti-sigma factor [Burkholderia gladioli]MBU9217156.1 anti-sigma factor [Burkholderia gladioli]MBU9427394.1 anti-sigma factor [Burkholderia gladioli]
MKPDDIQLLAYVDGKLPLPERAAIDQAMRASPALAGQVALLRASALPYRDAFATQALPPMPAGLAHKLEQLAREHAAAPAFTAPPGANDPAIAGHGAGATPPRSRLRVAPAWLAVAFVAGAFLCGGILQFAPGAVGLDAPFGAGSAPRTWIAAAAGYQQLYSRDTLASVNADPAATASTLDEIRRVDGFDMTIPDLRAAGLTFKRVQRLRFEGRPLVQIVYLPEHGAPIALCVMKEAKPDQAIASRSIAQMDVVNWRQSTLAYALIGQPGDADLALIAQRISAPGAAPLYSALPAAAPAHAG